MTQLMFIHINKTFSSAGYKVHDVDENNINKHIDKSLLDRIAKLLNNKNNEVHKESLIRLALLQKYCGVSLLLNTLIT